jgi:carboxyl-terminal processing protease
MSIGDGANMKRKSELKFWIFVAFTGLTTAVVVINLNHTFSATPPTSRVSRPLELFAQVFAHVRAEHVDEPDTNQLIEAAISGMLSSLDPHTTYLNPKKFRDMQVITHGEFGGLGIEVTKEGGFVKVVSLIEGTPAARAGMHTDDLITHLDRENVEGLTLEQVVDKMRGAVNTPIVLTIVRRGVSAPFEVTISRDVIKVNPINSRLEANGAAGYIKISTFNEQTNVNLVKAVEMLIRSGGKFLKGFIIDLRNNPGGLLDQAVAVAENFLENGVVVITKGRRPEDFDRRQARRRDLTRGQKLVVLVNGGSASASEIVAGALQDLGRATIIGTHTFGKGSVQTITPLGVHGGLRLTTARFYTPSGHSVQAQGIEPDFVVEQEPAGTATGSTNVKASGEASLPGHLNLEPGNGKENFGSSAYVPSDQKKDTQLQYALRLITDDTKTMGRLDPLTNKREAMGLPN